MTFFKYEAMMLSLVAKSTLAWLTNSCESLLTISFFTCISLDSLRSANNTSYSVALLPKSNYRIKFMSFWTHKNYSRPITYFPERAINK